MSQPLAEQCEFIPYAFLTISAIALNGITIIFFAPEEMDFFKRFATVITSFCAGVLISSEPGIWLK
ncbi:MAG: hypothetical protein JJT87_12495 [Halomonas sp.]|nr:hypothetical protein [Halomonas sp.]MCC5902729.1 hypothetical protein [Halomonas sp.]